MIRTFYLVRHAETEWNKIGRLQGHSDIPLSETGQAQAKNLQAFIHKLNPESIYSSPLKRALQTAETASALLSMKITTDPRLMEVKLGEVEGLTGPEIFAKYGEASFDRWRNLDWKDDFAYPGGETKKDSVARMEKFLREFDFGTHKKVMLVSHGLVLRRFLGWISGNADFVRIPNTTVFELELDTVTAKFEYRGVIFQPGMI